MWKVNGRMNISVSALKHHFFTHSLTSGLSLLNTGMGTVSSTLRMMEDDLEVSSCHVSELRPAPILVKIRGGSNVQIHVCVASGLLTPCSRG